MTEAKHKCCAHLRSDSPWRRGPVCGKSAMTEVLGNWYCGTHNPEKVQARKAIRDAERRSRYGAEFAERQKRIAADRERERRADAYPELLEALRGAVALADENKAQAEDEGRWVIRPPRMQAMYDKCVAAIAKATGEQA